jgi:hypothetical protein
MALGLLNQLLNSASGIVLLFKTSNCTPPPPPFPPRPSLICTSFATDRRVARAIHGGNGLDRAQGDVASMHAEGAGLQQPFATAHQRHDPTDDESLMPYMASGFCGVFSGRPPKAGIRFSRLAKASSIIEFEATDQLLNYQISDCIYGSISKNLPHQTNW